MVTDGPPTSFPPPPNKYTLGKINICRIVSFYEPSFNDLAIRDSLQVSRSGQSFFFFRQEQDKSTCFGTQLNAMTQQQTTPTTPYVGTSRLVQGWWRDVPAGVLKAIGHAVHGRLRGLLRGPAEQGRAGHTRK